MPYHFVIINVAFADLLACIFASFTIRNVMFNKLFWGKIECVFLFHLGGWIAPSASGWLLLLLSFMRYRIVVTPFKAKLKLKTCAIATLLIWIISCSCGSYLMATIEYTTNGRCMSKNHREILAYRGILFIFDFIIPATMMLYFYQKMRNKLNTEIGNESRTRQKRNQKALKTVKYLLIVFVITVCPGKFFLIVSELFLWFSITRGERLLFSTCN